MTDLICPNCSATLSLTAEVAALPTPPPPPAPKYLLPVDYTTRPDSGPAWDAMLAAAKGTWPAPNLVNQDSRHGLYVLAAAFVYARTQSHADYDRAWEGIDAAVATFNATTTNGALSLGRQLPAYILAANALLPDKADSNFSEFLRSVRDSKVGTHGRWNSLSFTFGDSSNNWGAHAGAAVIAIDRYLGNSIEEDGHIFNGFTGLRDVDGGHTFPKPNIAQPSWVAPTAGSWTPTQMAPGDPRDGAVTEDAWRSGPYPTLSNTYVMDSAQALALQAELLDHWSMLEESAAFLKRNPSVWTTSGGRGGRGLAYLYNARLSLGVPTTNTGDRMAWSLAWMDWLYAE